MDTRKQSSDNKKVGGSGYGVKTRKRGRTAENVTVANGRQLSSEHIEQCVVCVKSPKAKKEKPVKSNEKRKSKSAKKLDFSQTNNNAMRDLKVKSRPQVECTTVKMNLQTVINKTADKCKESDDDKELSDDGVKILVDTTEFDSSDEGENSQIGFDQENSDEEIYPVRFNNQTVVNYDTQVDAEPQPVTSGYMVGPVSETDQRSKAKDGLDEEDYVKLIGDPMFRKVFHKLFHDEMGDTQAERTHVTTDASKPKPKTKLNQRLQQQRQPIMSDVRNVNSKRQGRMLDGVVVANNQNIVKSPSDTTLYAPALKKLAKENDAISKISNFIETVWLEVESDKPSPAVMKKSVNLQQVPGYDAAKKKAQHSMVEAEKFKAKIIEPTGTFMTANPNLITEDLATLNSEINAADGEVATVDLQAPFPFNQLPHDLVVQGKESLSDDNFFHLTCHIEPSLRGEIERGEYVDLEKLLPHDKTRKLSDEARLEWVHKDGSTFLVPATDKESKISSIRRWDQAFRVYATIYCGINPHTAKEIWQYVSVINTAAATYIWDNVANYDYTFRHLMEFNPNRSWAKTYRCGTFL